VSRQLRWLPERRQFRQIHPPPERPARPGDAPSAGGHGMEVLLDGAQIDLVLLADADGLDLAQLDPELDRPPGDADHLRRAEGAGEALPPLHLVQAEIEAEEGCVMRLWREQRVSVHRY